MTQVPLFPSDAELPPVHCSKCGGAMTYVAFHIRACQQCGWRWERSAQITGSEPWPEDVL